MSKIDLKKELRGIYEASTDSVSVVEVPQNNYLMIDGEGDPNRLQQYQQALEALYGVSYALKFMVKQRQKLDYVVMPLEGLWWADDMTEFSMENKEAWKWTMMILQSGFVTAELAGEAVSQVQRKKICRPQAV